MRGVRQACAAGSVMAGVQLRTCAAMLAAFAGAGASHVLLSGALIATFGGGIHLSDVDTGLLVIALHVLRQTVERHKVLLSAGERASFFEDLEDFESEQYDCEGKMLVLHRIYRTQPALLASGGASSAGGGAAAAAEFGPGMQFASR